MSNDDERAELQELLALNKRNLNTLRKQAELHGGESLAPLIVINQLRGVREQIADLEAKLRQLDAEDAAAMRSVVSLGRSNNQRGATITIGNVAGGDIVAADLPQLRQLLVQSFSDGELRDLCFELGIDYENLPGSGKSDKARELVRYAHRHAKLSALVIAGRQLRPQQPWPGRPAPSVSAAVPTTNMPTEVVLSFQQYGDDTRIEWESPLLGSRTTVFVPPYADDVLPLVIRALDAVQHPNHPSGGPQFSSEAKTLLSTLGLWQNNRVPASAHKTVGQAIYQALGTDGKNALETVRSFGIAQGQQISYVLRFPREAVNLAALPWEALWDRDQAVLLSRGHAVDSCERYMNIDRALPPPLATGQTLHALALTPAYGIPDTIRNDERAARLASWDSLKAQGLMTYDEVGGPLTVRKLSDYLRKAPRRPDIVHYFGHGVYKDGEGHLLFDDGAGKPVFVSSTRLAAMLGDVRLMVILACQSAMVEEEGGLLTGIAPALSLVTGAVVAMQLSVRITAATRFAEIFYDELLSQHDSLQDAVAAARQTLFFEEDDSASWYVPVLYIRSRDQKRVYMVEA